MNGQTTLGPLPAVAVAHPVCLCGAGHMSFTGGNPPPGGNLTALGTATHLGQGTIIGVLNFRPTSVPSEVVRSRTYIST
jgi:hypothetical protein